jgi:putative transcriptional regulator
MNQGIFDLMVSGFDEAKKYRAGKKAKVRVSRMAFEPIDFKPTEIRHIRSKLGLSQPTFAEFLGISVGTVRSWEQGVRKPEKSAKRLLVIAKEKPALLLHQQSA